jgi:hypothetical protein
MAGGAFSIACSPVRMVIDGIGQAAKTQDRPIGSGLARGVRQQFSGR